MPMPTATLPDVDYLCGLAGNLGETHAIRHARAAAPGYRGEGDAAITAAVCGQYVRIVASFGRFQHHGNRAVSSLCPPCAWEVAIKRGAVTEEIEALTPSGLDLAALQRATPHALLAVQLSQAVVTRETNPGREYDLDHGRNIQLLATIARHRPTLAVPEYCADGTCDHRPSDAALDADWGCDLPTATAVCSACSLSAGDWAGEWESTFMGECYIEAPCQVLTAMAAPYGLGPGAAAATP